MLGNDSDVDSATLTAAATNGPSHGSLTFYADGSFIYTPIAGFTGTDSFSYQTSDGTLADGATVTITVGTAMHVGDLDGASTSQGSTWTATVTITVHDASYNPVSDATVSGDWSNGASGSASCTTDATGMCSVSKAQIRKRTGSVTFTVRGVTHVTLTYDATLNHDPDGSSNGNTITVLKP